MENKALEILFLEKMVEMNSGLQVIPFEDLKNVNGRLKLPRCIARTLSNHVIHRYDSQRSNKDDVVAFHQTNINRHLISFSFVGLKFEEVAKIRNFFSNIVSVQWWKICGGYDFVLEQVGELKNITDHTTSDTLERYVMDIVVRTKTKTKTEIEIIKKVEFEIKGGI